MAGRQAIGHRGSREQIHVTVFECYSFSVLTTLVVLFKLKNREGVSHTWQITGGKQVGQRGYQVTFPRLFFSVFNSLAFTHFDFVPFLRLHDGQAERGRSTGADRWKLGNQAGRSRNKARSGGTGQGVRASWQEGTGIGGGQEGRRGRRGWKN